MTTAVTLPVISVVDDNSHNVSWNAYTSYIDIPGTSFTANHRYLIFCTTECYAGYYATSIFLRGRFDGVVLDRSSSGPAACGGDSSYRQFVMTYLVTAPPASGSGFQFQAARMGGSSANWEYIYKSRVIAIDLDVDQDIFPSGAKGWIYSPVTYFGMIMPDTTFQTAVSSTFTGDGGDYLVIATGVLWGSGNPGYSEFRLYNDIDSDYPTSIIRNPPTAGSYYIHQPTCTVARVFSALSGSHTFSAQVRRQTSGAGGAQWQDLRIIVLRLNSFTSRASDYHSPGTNTNYADTSYHAYRTTSAMSPALTTGDNVLVFRCMESLLYGTSTSNRYNNRLTQLPSTTDDSILNLAGLQQVGYYPYDTYDETQHTFCIALSTADNTAPQFSHDVAGNTASYPSYRRSTLVALKAEVSAPIVRQTTDSYIITGFPKDHITDSLLQKAATVVHTTDSRLIPSPVQHTSNSLLYLFQQKQHFTDSVLIGNLQLVHGADCLIAGVAREPEFSTITEFTTTEGENIGAHDVMILGPSGNAVVPQQFSYDRPPQEAILSKSAGIELDIIDAIVKDEV